MTGELAVCAASCGPGNLHLINGLFDANRSRVPVLAIAAHIPREEIGGGYFQETHPQELFRECSVYRELISVPEQLPRVRRSRCAALERAAWRSSWSRRDFLERAGPDTGPPIAPAASIIARPTTRWPPRRRSTPPSGVTILAGAGCRGAHDELVALAGVPKGADRPYAARQGVPRVRQPLRRRDDRPAGIRSGLPRDGALRHAAHARQRLPLSHFYPENATVIQVDIRGEQIGRRVPVDLPLVGTVKDTVAALMPRLNNGRDARISRGCRRTTAARASGSTRSRRPRERGPIHPQVTADAGPARRRRRDLPRRRRHARGLGGPLPAHERPAPAARLLHPRVDGQRTAAGDRRAGLSPRAPGGTLSGDGGLAMLLGELITLRQQRLPVKVVVFNNGALAFVELEMKAAGSSPTEPTSTTRTSPTSPARSGCTECG